MHILPIFFTLSLWLNLLFTQHQSQLAKQAVSAEAAALSGNIQIYRQAVLEYAHANISFTGAAAEADLKLPTWFKPLPTLRNYIAQGKGYVYHPTPQPELAYTLTQATHHSWLTGVKRSGHLYHPTRGASSIPLPVAIPENSVVYAEG